MTDQDIMTLAALVAAYVGVIKKLGLPANYSPIAALAIAAVFVLAPAAALGKLTAISVIGLTAAGAYSYVKNKDGGS